MHPINSVIANSCHLLTAHCLCLFINVTWMTSKVMLTLFSSPFPWCSLSPSHHQLLPSTLTFCLLWLYWFAQSHWDLIVFTVRASVNSLCLQAMSFLCVWATDLSTNSKLTLFPLNCCQFAGISRFSPQNFPEFNLQFHEGLPNRAFHWLPCNLIVFKPQSWF